MLGDPSQLEFTELLESLGWRPSEKTAFTLLPVVIQVGHERSRIFELPSDAVLEVPIRHPDLPWFEELRLRWHAVPMLCDMALEAGGLRYPAAPFNGWYMSSEIGARNLSDVDRYNQLPLIARRSGAEHPELDKSVARSGAGGTERRGAAFLSRPPACAWSTTTARRTSS